MINNYGIITERAKRKAKEFLAQNQTSIVVGWNTPEQRIANVLENLVKKPVESLNIETTPEESSKETTWE